MELRKILKGDFDNHVLPFLWIHGESEDVYRENVRAIYHANIRAFCIEARPHKDFCGPRWWEDLAILLDEAERLGMKVWILDDRHFPTGYAAGGAEKAPAELRRQSLFYKEYPVRPGRLRLNLKKECHPPFSPAQKAVDVMNKNTGMQNHFHDDTVITAAALRLDGKASEPVSLSEYVHDGVLEWTVPEGNWIIQICFLSGNAGVHRSYINMMDAASCRIQIDQVYEPHYQHFKDKFGTVIAGFFSDEPELGNGLMFRMYNLLGTDQDLPWSRELKAALRERLGRDYRRLLPLLWSNEGDETLTARVRYTYMDCVSRLVENDFSKQIGMWCREHGVEYIGHLVEDNNQHARTGTSLGHYFRGLKWQTMGGIDLIGGSLYPQKEEMTGDAFIWKHQPIDGEFYHFALARMGSSLGQLNPGMKGRTMCELFGNYGWAEGVRLEKFLLDHCLVRGIDYFVPHAFDCKAYPDKDCPPHFYAHGHDPLYRHFGQLMAYTNRASSLLDEYVSETPAAILYHAEAEWCSIYSGERSNPQTATGKDAVREGYMLMQKPARILTEHQIDFHFVPADVFSERAFYHTQIGKKLVINGRAHKILIIPYAKYIPQEAADAIVELRENDGEVIFLEQLPDGICQGGPIPEEIRHCPVIPLNGLADYIDKLLPDRVKLLPESPRMRLSILYGNDYCNGAGKNAGSDDAGTLPEETESAGDAIFLVNEDDKPYAGTVQLPWTDGCYLYDPWDNRIREHFDGGMPVKIRLRASESVFIMRGGMAQEGVHTRMDTSSAPQLSESDIRQAVTDAFREHRKESDGSENMGRPVSPGAEGNSAYTNTKRIPLTKFSVSRCRSIDYPAFEADERVHQTGDYAAYEPGFSGFIRYETEITLKTWQKVTLTITDAHEGVEVFVNGRSAGIQILPEFRYDMTALCKKGQNRIRIEVATTLERENAGKRKHKNAAPTGITGNVYCEIA